MAEKPSVLIIGGLGYIGRFLTLHIHRNQLASDVRIVDKALPQLAWLAPEFVAACSGDKFMQADASRERESSCSPPAPLSVPADSRSARFRVAEMLTRIFDRPDGNPWDCVFNCGGETRYSQEDEVYKVRSLALSLAVGKEAAKRGVKCFVELSTGMVYKPDASPSKEQDRLKPWNKIAVYKLQAEEELAKIQGFALFAAPPPRLFLACNLLTIHAFFFFSSSSSSSPG